MSSSLETLMQLMAKLRAPDGCPWDRKQTHESLKPYLVEEAYEVLEAIDQGDPGRLREELGDVLLQIVFHTQIAGEYERFSMEDVMRSLSEKLIRRHPHVFGETEVANAGEVLRNWDAIKATEAGREPGIFGEVPENLPSLLYARKVQRRAASTGFDMEDVPFDAVAGQLEALEAAAADPAARDARFEAAGDLLFAAVNVARKLKVDPELALRAATDRFRGRIEVAEALAAQAGQSWNDLSPEQQLGFYAQARFNE
jgi:XTP/dITP diphosphohydrolase/tetrapyrrole methylase family protein/MazG family protein/ATP diphosphatase